MSPSHRGLVVTKKEVGTRVEDGDLSVFRAEILNFPGTPTDSRIEL